MMVSVYLTLTRQVMAACIFAVFISSFLGDKNAKKRALLLGAIFIIGLYGYYDVLFSSLSEQTEDETTDDNIRLFSAAYFWNESLNSPLTFLFGYGNHYYASAFGKFMKRLNEDYGFYIGDVGFIGQIYQKGVLYVIMTYWLFFKLYFRFKRQIPQYIKMMVLFCVPMTPMIFAMYSPLYYGLWIMLIYITDLHINKSPLALESTRNKSNI